MIRHVGLAVSSSLCTVSRSMNLCRALTLAVGILTSENGLSSIILCLRATCKNVRANESRLATVAAARSCVSNHALNWSPSPAVMLPSGLSSPKKSVTFRQGCCQTSNVAGFTSGRDRM